MSVEQRTDDDSVELSTVIQLSPHATTDKVSVVSRSEEGTEYVSLDEVYEVTGQESIRILADNCRQYLAHQRLSPSAFQVLQISGMEGLVPGYDRFNAYKGGESFLEALKNGFVTIIKAIKRFVIAVIDWVVVKVKSVLGFSKTEKELQIVAELSDDVKKDLGTILGNIVGVSGLNFDIAEMYAALPGTVTTTEAFTIIQNKNKTNLEQLEALTNVGKDLEKAEELILRAGNQARQSTSRYQAAAKKLRKAFGDKQNFSMADVIEFRSAIDEEVGNNLNPEPLRQAVAELVDKAYGIELGEIGVGKDFKDNLRQHREALNAGFGIRVTEKDYENVRKVAKVLPKILLRSSSHHFDASTLTALKDTFNVDDAKLIEAIDGTFEKVGVLKLNYTTYCSSISEYTAALEYLITICGQIRRSIASVVNWSNKVDKLMLSYISKDLNNMIKTEQEVLTPTGRKITAITNDKGEQIDTAMEINYEAMYISKHPYLSPVVMTARAHFENLKKQYKIIDRINAGLKSLGVPNRI